MNKNNHGSIGSIILIIVGVVLAIGLGIGIKYYQERLVIEQSKIKSNIVATTSLPDITENAIKEPEIKSQSTTQVINTSDFQTLGICRAAEGYLGIDIFYSKDKNGVYCGNPNGSNNKIEGADLITFESIGNEYAKDKNRVFFRQNVLTNADVATFEILKDGYAKDKNYVYYAGTLHYEGLILRGADAATFNVLSNNYAKDKVRVYFLGNVVAGADSATFEIAENGYAMDKDYIYSRNHPVSRIDTPTIYYADSFRNGIATTTTNHIRQINSNTLEYCYLGDIYHEENCRPLYRKGTVGWREKEGYIYYQKDTILQEADFSTFQMLGDGYAKDKNNVYYSGRVLIGADAVTFSSMGESYAKDKNNVYYEDSVLSGANPQSFFILLGVTFEHGYRIGDYGYAQDNTHLYLFGKLLAIDDPNNLLNDLIKYSNLLNSHYRKDKNGVYYQSVVVEGVDPSTFRVIIWDFAKDKNYVYNRGTILGGADSATFEAMTSSCLQDKNNVYNYNSTNEKTTVCALGSENCTSCQR